MPQPSVALKRGVCSPTPTPTQHTDSGTNHKSAPSDYLRNKRKRTHPSEFLYPLLSEWSEGHTIPMQAWEALHTSIVLYPVCYIQDVYHLACVQHTFLHRHDGGHRKMGHKHAGWQGNIAMGLHEIARSRGRFEGVNRRISGKSSAPQAVELTSILSRGGGQPCHVVEQTREDKRWIS